MTGHPTADGGGVEMQPRLNYPAVLAALKLRPGKWAVVDTAPRTPNSVRTLRRQYRVDVTTRKMSDGTVCVWAAWPTGKVVPAAVNAVAKHNKTGDRPAPLMFSDPPPVVTGGRKTASRYDDVAATVRSRPGQWLFVGATDKNGRVSVGVSLRKRGCEVVTRSTSKNTYSVWARWPTRKPVGSLPVRQPDPSDLWHPPPLRLSRKEHRPAELDYLGVAEAVFGRQGRWAQIWEGAPEESKSVRRWFTTQGFDTSSHRAEKVNVSNVDTVMIWVRWPQKMDRRTVAALQKKLKLRAPGNPPTLRWCNPPKKKSPRKGKYTHVVTQLQQKPGAWALVGTYPKTEAHKVDQGLRRSGCDVTRRTNNNEATQSIWARWPEQKTS